MILLLIHFYEKNRSWLDRIPVINRFPMIVRRRQRRAWITGKKNQKEVFTYIYRNNLWNASSASGPGSTEEGTKELRHQLPRIVEQFAIQSILDAPCGDFYWFPKIAFNRPLRYIGADIVEELVANNQRAHATSDVSFRTLDITSGPLPAADLWLCRDCWIHLSAEDIQKALGNFLRSNIKYLLATNYPDCQKNHPIITGEFRPINLGIAPFFFPPPLAEIDDPLNKYPHKKLGLWSRNSLAAKGTHP